MIAVHASKIAAIREAPDDAHGRLERLRGPDAVMTDAAEKIPKGSPFRPVPKSVRDL